ncbi:MAG TPA: FAD-dependent oxidoreductase [Candidatus Limnocylindria bacterium]|jgi:cation diffusion facilitator CzcD-associated flavoprotein CzcO|nr:FAD-dependent oxidoreductase [Candidatus Limnocylindria bacterium]
MTAERYDFHGTDRCEVAIVGAGPYGLSLAAHLRDEGVGHRIFGLPMQTWQDAMPRGMFLESEAHASSLSAPGDGWTLEQYCRESRIPELVKSEPVPLDTFTGYGLAFARRCVPHLETTTVTALWATADGFDLRLATGERLRARRVVLALGTTYFKRVPAFFSGLPAELVSHAADHRDLGALGRREVVVIGGGQSALETAALLHEQGAAASVLMRAPEVVWNGDPLDDPSWLEALRLPSTGLGRGWRLWFYCHGQPLFGHLPERLRVDRVARELGPAGAWWLKPRVVGRIKVRTGHGVLAARADGDRLALKVAGPRGEVRELRADHVVAATGYQVDVGAIPFLDASLARRLDCVGTAPRLSGSFESSVPGLYFVGLASAVRFGPSMRFLIGADFAARRIAAALRGYRRRSVSAGPSLRETPAA